MGVDKYWWLNQVTYASNSWPENDSYNELDAVSLLSDLSDTEAAIETLNTTSLRVLL